GVGMGPAWFRSFGRGLLTVDATALLGGEVLDGLAPGMGTLHAAVGGGYAFSSTKSVLRRYDCRSRTSGSLKLRKP
ncbi:MAG: hypothetical protein QM756_15835, partial [Polyangiaceae bacterium]